MPLSWLVATVTIMKKNVAVIFFAILTATISLCNAAPTHVPPKEDLSYIGQSYLSAVKPFKKLPDKRYRRATRCDFSSWFEDGHVVKAVVREELVKGGSSTVEEPELTVHVEKIDSIYLPSGSIVACDPYNIKNALRFARSVKPGRYSCFLCHETYGRPLAVKLLFGAGRVVKWERALRSSQGAKDSPGAKRDCYSVNNGTGCFVDAAARELLTGKQESLSQRLSEGFYEGRLPQEREERICQWFAIDADSQGNSPNLIAFESGKGDGCYTSWWGMDAHDHPLCLITDFGMLDETASVTVSFTDISRLCGRYLSHPLLDRFNQRIRVTRGPIEARSLHFESESLPNIHFEDKNGTRVATKSESLLRTDGVQSEVFIFENSIDSSLKVQLDFCVCTGPRS